MKVEVLRTEHGLFVKSRGMSVTVDGENTVRADYHLVTHAHSDHLPRGAVNRVIASRETMKLAEVRGVRLVGVKSTPEKIRLVDSGHVLGSKGFLIGDDVLITGDLCTEDRFFMRGFRPPRARVLIMEATYGRRDYVFGRVNEIIDEAVRFTAEVVSSGGNILAVGYSLGKAQILTRLFSWHDKLAVDETVLRINRVYEGFGIALGRYRSFLSILSSGELKNGGWIVISGGGRRVRSLARKLGMITVGFTGWAANRSYTRWSGADAGFPLSDHSDFKGLVKVVKEVSPDLVLVAYGFSEEFSRELKKEGFDARPLRPGDRVEVNL